MGGVAHSNGADSILLVRTNFEHEKTASNRAG
jgi:hypothetical protein